MSRCKLYVFFALLLLGASAAPRCGLRSPSSLRHCVRGLLQTAQPALRKQFSFQKLPDVSGEVRGVPWRVTDVMVSGAANFRVGKIKVKMVTRRNVTSFRVSFRIRWPRLVVGMKGVIKVCEEITHLGHCVDIHGRPKLKAKRSLGKVTTTVHFVRSAHSGMNVTTDETKVKVAIRGVDSKTMLENTGGMEMNQFWLKATLLTNDLLIRLWESQKPTLVRMLTRQLRQLVSSYLPAALEKALRSNPPRKRRDKADTLRDARRRSPRTQTEKRHLKRSLYVPLLRGNSFSSSKTEANFTTNVVRGIRGA